MNVLGINSYFEAPSVALIQDGRLVFAAEDERFTRIKHGRKYSPHRTYVPFDAMHAALRFAGLSAGDLDAIGYSYNRWDHLRGLWGCVNRRRMSPLRDELSGLVSLTHLRQALRGGYELLERHRDVLDPEALGRIRLENWNHHRSHAASAFHCSGFDDALVVVADGAGERASTSVFRGRGGTMELLAEDLIPHSLGLFYTFVTRHLGFEPFSDEYKVMGLAAYGEPRFRGRLERVLSLRRQGHCTVDKRHLLDLTALVGRARRPGDEVEQRHKDIASSAQALLEDAVKHVVVHHARSTGARHLCLAGGTFLNCVANGELARTGLFDAIFVQPAAHDAGTAIGAAALSARRRGGPPQLEYESMALGTGHDDAAVERALATAGLGFERVAEDAMVERLAQRLAAGRVCGLFRGRMEFGPRALGMRSVLADPGDPHMRHRLNVIKGREQFRPVAPMIAREAFDDYFEGEPNRYMMFTVRARERARSSIPSAVHVDGTARVQTVARADDPFLAAVLERFAAERGYPVLINTSFNGPGEPIVEKPADAISGYLTSQIDCLAIGGFFLEK